jgi:hypothetical protein
MTAGQEATTLPTSLSDVPVEHKGNEHARGPDLEGSFPHFVG